MDDFGAPGGQVQVSFKFYYFFLKMDDFGARGGQVQISYKFD